MREIAKAVHDNPALLETFVKDPEAVARDINGFEVPEGYHLHIADAQNNLYPAEETGAFGSEDKSSWSRIEFRAGYKTISLVMCVVNA
jgi:hypothetical protein